MDQYSNAWMQSEEGRKKLAFREKIQEIQQHNADEYTRFDLAADEKARELDFIPEKLLEKKTFLENRMFLQNSFFPNIDEVFPDENSTKMYLSLLDTRESPFFRENNSKSIEIKNLKEAAEKRRVSNYFYEDVQDFSQNGMFDLFITYLKATRDFDSKRLAKISSLTDDDIKELMRQFPEDKLISNFDFNDIDLFMSHPKVYDREQAEKIIKDRWFNKNVVIGYGYDVDTYYPSHMGMSQSDIEFRQKLDAVSKEILGQSIYELNFDGQTYFDRLWKNQQYDELIAEHYDEFLAKIKSTGSYDFLIDDLSFDENGMLTDKGWNKQFLPIIDSLITPEDEVHLSGIYGYNQKRIFYMQNRALQGKILNRNTLKNIINRSGESADFLFAHKDELNKDILKAIYEDAWLYAQGSKSGQYLKKEYQELFGENIENVKETWNEKYPVGSSRFDILCRKKDVDKIASEYPDEFLKLPVEQSKGIIQNASIKCDKNFNVEPEYQDILNLVNKYINKFGLEVLIENIYNNDLEKFLAVRYMQGVREPKEIEYLRKKQRHNDVLEAEFNKSGDTLKTISDVPDLLMYKDFEKVDLILKRGYKFDSEEQKYQCLHDFIYCAQSDSGKDSKVQKYVDDFIKNANIDWKKAEINQYFSESNTLDFMLERYGKNPAISKKDLEYMTDKARRCENISDNAMKKLRELGYDFKPHMAYQLIQYDRKRRAVSIELEGRDLSQYDFEVKFFLDRPYHPSSHSHTTFLNETLHYWEKEATVAALNNGASPFNKAGFFMDKFEAMPFNMMFSKALKENKSQDLKEFMGYIAANLDESKKGVLKDIWTSLGQKLRDDTRVQSIIRDTDKILKSRDFTQERIDKELKRKAEEEYRKQQEEHARIEQEKRLAEEKRREEERLAEEKRREEERQIEQEKRRHEEAISHLKQNILASLTDIASMDNKTIVENITRYLEDNKSELPVVPNANELSSIKIAAFEKKTEELKLKQKQNEEKQAQMAQAIQKAIEEKEKEQAIILSPKEVGEFITKYFEEDAEAKPFVSSTIKKFSEEAEEKSEIQKKLTKVNKVVADKLLDFYEEEPLGFNYFTSVGKERRNWGYTVISISVMKELQLPYPKGDILDAPKKEQDLFNKVKDKVVELIDKTNEQSYDNGKKNALVDPRYEFLADMADYEPEKADIDEKEILKQAKKEVKKNKKGESVVNSLAALAALRDKFGNGKD